VQVGQVRDRERPFHCHGEGDHRPRCPPCEVHFPSGMQEQPRFHAYRGDKPPVFANDAELECAQILDYHGIPWDYEPHTFTLEVDEDGNTLEAFSPDFYLPEQDLYLEITTMKQSLVTKKNRKMRRLRELRPDVRVKLFYKRDVEALAEKYELGEAS
jgi:hypothetical protein